MSSERPLSLGSKLVASTPAKRATHGARCRCAALLLASRASNYPQGVDAVADEYVRTEPQRHGAIHGAFHSQKARRRRVAGPRSAQPGLRGKGRQQRGLGTKPIGPRTWIHGQLPAAW